MMFDEEEGGNRRDGILLKAIGKAKGKSGPYGAGVTI